MFTKDLLERVARTFVQAFAATWLAGAVNLADVNAVKAAGIAGLSAGVAAVMGLLTKPLGPNDDTASVL